MTIRPDQLPGTDEALSNTIRLLHEAEMETDLSKKDRTLSLAESWLDVAAFQYERTR